MGSTPLDFPFSYFFFYVSGGVNDDRQTTANLMAAGRQQHVRARLIERERERKKERKKEERKGENRQNKSPTSGRS